MSWLYGQTAEFTPTSTAVTVTDTPLADRYGGPDGSLSIADVYTDTPSASRHAGPIGSVSTSTPADTPSAQRSAGPDGLLSLVDVYTDTPSASRHAGPAGALQINLAATDAPSGYRLAGPDGVAQLGIIAGTDTPGSSRSAGPDGLPTVDLAITDRPTGYRQSGPDGVAALGLTFGPDTPGSMRYAGPVGSVFADTNPSVAITDTAGSSRHAGPDGVAAFGVVLTGDTPSSTRHGGPDGVAALGVALTDASSAARYAGPDGFALIIVGGTDTAGSNRYSGPDGAMGIVVPLAGDTPNGYRSAGPVGVLVIGIGADIVVGPTTPGGSRYSGPDGQVLLAVLPTRIPYVTPAPLVIPGYALWVADTRTGRMLWELPMGSSSWSSTLGSVGTMRATIEIEKTWDSLSDQDERDPRIMLREVLTGPWRFSLVLLWGNNVVWAGPYVSLHRPAPNSVELSASEGMALYGKRVLVAPGAISAVDPTADTAITSYTTKGHTAFVLLSQALTGTGNNLPIIVVDSGGTPITTPTDYFGFDLQTYLARIYYGYDLRTYLDALTALSAEIDGPEIRLDPTVTAGSDANYLSWVAQIGSPYVGTDSTPWTFDSDVSAIVGYDSDASAMAQSVWSGGTGSSRDKLIAHSEDTSLLSIGWPMLESVDTAHNSEVIYSVLASQNVSVLTAQKNAVSSFSVQVPADADPMVGTYHVGEYFRLDVRDDPVVPDGTYTRRIAAIAGTEKPWVTITDVDPPPPVLSNYYV